jgi:hypothetical protein
LADLIQRGSGARPALASLMNLAATLNPFAVHIRYPGFATNESLAKSAVQTARKLRAALRRELGLVGRPRKAKKPPRRRRN